jgi:hypothetical protein
MVTSDDAPELDGVLREVDRDSRNNNDLYTHRETSALTNEIPEESDQFHLVRGFLYLLTCHLDLLYHCRASFVGDDLFHD